MSPVEKKINEIVDSIKFDTSQFKESDGVAIMVEVFKFNRKIDNIKESLYEVIRSNKKPSDRKPKPKKQ